MSLTITGGPRAVAVDLTPMLPGGENGGAKVFVLELLRRLPLLAPQTRFVLLTRKSSHDELAELDRANVVRHCVLDPSPAPHSASSLVSLAARSSRLLPQRIRAALSGVLFDLRRCWRKPASGGVLRQLGVDLLFCPFTAPTYAEAGIPVVSTLYDLQYRTFPQFFAPEDVAHRDAVFRASCRDSARIAAISDYARESALREEVIEPERIRTVHLRIAQRFAESGETAANSPLHRLGLDAGRYLLYPANFWKHKNHEMLLTAFGMAARVGLPQDIRLVCTGQPGERRNHLERACAAFGLSARVSFPGYVSTAEMAALLAHSGGVVFPSLYEGFGLPLVEAMAAGVPVAASRSTSLPEVAGDAALLFNPRIVAELADAMVRLVTDAALRAQLVDAGRRRAMEFTDTDRMVREYWQLFLEARAPVNRVNSLTGVYADGWIGRELQLDVAAAGKGASVELGFLAPDWLPNPAIRVQGERSTCGIWRRALRIRRGESAEWSIPAAAGPMRLRIGPGFVPARWGHGDGDQRELTLMLRYCRVRGADGALHTLWDAARA